MYQVISVKVMKQSKDIYHILNDIFQHFDLHNELP